jgi:hypothetical protein
MLREYTVFNVDQCDGLPDRIRAGQPMRVRNPCSDLPQTSNNIIQKDWLSSANRALGGLSDCHPHASDGSARARGVGGNERGPRIM